MTAIYKVHKQDKKMLIHTLLPNKMNLKRKMITKCSSHQIAEAGHNHSKIFWNLFFQTWNQIYYDQTELYSIRIAVTLMLQPSIVTTSEIWQQFLRDFYLHVNVIYDRSFTLLRNQIWHILCLLIHLVQSKVLLNIKNVFASIF